MGGWIVDGPCPLSLRTTYRGLVFQITLHCCGSRRSVLGSTHPLRTRSSRRRARLAGSVGESSRRPPARRSCSAPARCGPALAVTSGTRAGASMLCSIALVIGLPPFCSVKNSGARCPGREQGPHGPGCRLDGHRDLGRRRRRAPRTELTHRVEIAHRPQVERRRLQARALEGCTHSRFEVLRQRLHGSWGRDPACEDPLMHCGAWPSTTRSRLGGCF